MAGSLRELSAYRFDRANEELNNARDMLSCGKYKLALNRSYYTIFYAIKAVNALDEFDSSKHSGVIAHFNQYHVKRGEFPKESSKIIAAASSMREHADYEDFFVASRNEAEKQIQNAEYFVQLVCEFLKRKNIPEQLQNSENNL